MILFELTGDENHEVYRTLEASNGMRQYHFINSIVEASLKMGRLFLSTNIIKALNYHAITCLHVNAGEYRPCKVTVGNYLPPEHWKVQALMDDFVNTVNRFWKETESNPLVMVAYVLWKLNCIHPFINGNGRTARAACYYVLCVYAQGPLPGTVILPELLRQNRDRYVNALQEADKLAASEPDAPVYLKDLIELLDELIKQQIMSAQSAALPPAPDEPIR